MRFCKFVPLDTFSIIQSLRKTSSTSITHQSTALAWKTTFSHVLTLWKGREAPLPLPREVPTC